MTRSTDFGKSWTVPIVNGHAGQSVYSETTDTIVMITGWPPANASGDAGSADGGAGVADQVESGLECTYYLEKYCKVDAGKAGTCLACLKAPSHQVLKRCVLDPLKPILGLF